MASKICGIFPPGLCCETSEELDMERHFKRTPKERANDMLKQRAELEKWAQGHDPGIRLTPSWRDWLCCFPCLR